MIRLRLQFMKKIKLKKLFNDEEIRIEHFVQVGGRLETIEIDGVEYEAGGSIIHEKNLYMKRFVDELGERFNSFDSNDKNFLLQV